MPRLPKHCVLSKQSKHNYTLSPLGASWDSQHMELVVEFINAKAGALQQG